MCWCVVVVVVVVVGWWWLFWLVVVVVCVCVSWSVVVVVVVIFVVVVVVVVCGGGGGRGRGVMVLVVVFVVVCVVVVVVCGGGGADDVYDVCVSPYTPTHASDSGDRTPGSKLLVSPSHTEPSTAHSCKPSTAQKLFSGNALRANTNCQVQGAQGNTATEASTMHTSP